METIYKENQLNNYEVNILGKKWNSIAQCCEYYKISYSSVCVYKWKERCNNDTAVLHFIESKKRNSFYYRKKKWNNIKECCIYYDLDYNLVIAYMIIPELSEPPVRTLRATIPENESQIFR